MVDSTCLQEAEIWEGVHSKRFKVGSPQNGVECLQMRLLGSRVGKNSWSFTAAKENPVSQPEDLPQASPQEVRRICC